jgi:hypothetical protein
MQCFVLAAMQRYPLPSAALRLSPDGAHHSTDQRLRLQERVADLSRILTTQQHLWYDGTHDAERT